MVHASVAEHNRISGKAKKFPFSFFQTFFALHSSFVLPEFLEIVGESIFGGFGSKIDDYLCQYLPDSGKPGY